jgi:hypothetical protein
LIWCFFGRDEEERKGGKDRGKARINETGKRGGKLSGKEKGRVMGMEIKRNGKRAREAYTRLAEEGRGGNQLLQTPCSGKSLFAISSRYGCETCEKLVLLSNFRLQNSRKARLA